jgi:hypothetical protein
MDPSRTMRELGRECEGWELWPLFCYWAEGYLYRQSWLQRIDYLPKPSAQSKTRTIPDAGQTVNEVCSSRVVSSPAGQRYEVRFERALRPGFFLHGPWRLWSLVTRDGSWWVTVEPAHLSWPVLRERFADRDEAIQRSEEMATAIEDGSYAPPETPAWRRRRKAL